MKSSFKKNPAATDAAPATAQEPAANPDRTVATRPAGALSAPVTHQGRNDMGGEWVPKDSKLPRLNLVQKSSASDLLEAFDLGDLVLAKKVKLADPKSPVIVVPMGAGKDYQQKTPFGEGQGVVYPTAEAVLDNGGTLDYSKDAVTAQIYFGPRAHIQFAIKAPEGLSDLDLNFFPFTYTDGSRWAMSIYTVASSAWTSLAKELETFRRHNMIGIKGLVFGNFEMTTLFKQKPGQEWFVPQVKLVGENPTALIEFLDAIK